MLTFLFVLFLSIYVSKLWILTPKKQEAGGLDMAVTQIAIVLFGLSIAFGKEVSKISAGKDGLALELKSELLQVVNDGKTEINARLDLVRNILRSQTKAALSRNYSLLDDIMSFDVNNEIEFRDNLVACMNEAGLSPEETKIFCSDFNLKLYKHIQVLLYRAFDGPKGTFNILHGLAQFKAELPYATVCKIADQIKALPYYSTDKHDTDYEKAERDHYLNIIKTMIIISPEEWKNEKP